MDSKGERVNEFLLFRVKMNIYIEKPCYPVYRRALGNTCSLRKHDYTYIACSVSDACDLP